jgi:diadenosine tetraphosphatase ApaH/serine/threonine PP2A family protein phosphatase
MTKLKVGDKLYDYSLKEYTVSKIGRQYAYLDGGRWDLRVEIKSMQADGHTRFMLYTDKQAIADEKEHSELLSKIRQFFSMWSGSPVTLDQLRRINEIISENKQ